MKTVSRLMTIVVVCTALSAPAAMGDETTAQPASNPATFSVSPEGVNPHEQKSKGFTCDADLAYHFDKECAAFDANQQSEAGRSLCCHSVGIIT